MLALPPPLDCGEHSWAVDVYIVFVYFKECYHTQFQLKLILIEAYLTYLPHAVHGIRVHVHVQLRASSKERAWRAA